MLKLWRLGKEQNTKFLSQKINVSTSILSIVVGMGLGILLLFPFVLLVYQFVAIYGYLFLASQILIYVVGIPVGLIFFMLLNALISVISMKYVECKIGKEHFQDVNYKAVFIYQVANPGFVIFVIAIIVLSGMVI